MELTNDDEINVNDLLFKIVKTSSEHVLVKRLLLFLVLRDNSLQLLQGSLNCLVFGIDLQSLFETLLGSVPLSLILKGEALSPETLYVTRVNFKSFIGTLESLLGVLELKIASR